MSQPISVQDIQNRVLSFVVCRFVVVSSQRCHDLWWSNVVDILLGIVAMKMRFLPQILQNSL